MITTKHTMAAIGFGFVAMWIATNFGYAILCLVGAAIFYIAAAVVQGELDLSDFPREFGRRSPPGDSGFSSGTAPPHRGRVQ